MIKYKQDKYDKHFYFQHSAVSSSESTELSAESDTVEFPPHLLLQLVRVAILFGNPEAQSHMNTRYN
jgi:hypothetical protein